MASGSLQGVVAQARRAALLHNGSALSDSALSDGQLLDCFLRGREEAAFAALVRRHGPMVLGVCRRVLRHVHDAEDAFQAVFLVLVRKATSLRGRDTIGNWLHGVAYHTALKARAASVRRRAKEYQAARDQAARYQAPEQQPARHGAAHDPDSWHDLVPLLDRELQRLPEKYRAAVVLCDLEGKSRKDAAALLRIPEGTLSSRLAAARRILARHLNAKGVTLSGGALATLLARQSASAAVPLNLVCSTVKSATLFAAGQTVAQTAAAGVISTHVAALAKGVMHVMLLQKLKSVVAVALVLGTLAAVTGVVLRPGAHAMGAHAMAGDGVAAAQKSAPQKSAPAAGAEKEAQRSGADAEFRLFLGERIPAADAEFVRRLFLDLCGVPPTPLEMHYFLAASDQKRREALIDILIAGHEANKQPLSQRLWRSWLTERNSPAERLFQALSKKSPDKKTLEMLVDDPKKVRAAAVSALDELIIRNWLQRGMVRHPGAKDRLDELLDQLLRSQKSDEQVLEALCLATLGRLPTEGEKKFIVSDVARQANRRDAWEHVLRVPVATEESRQFADALGRRTGRSSAQKSAPKQ